MKTVLRTAYCVPRVAYLRLIELRFDKNVRRQIYNSFLWMLLSIVVIDGSILFGGPVGKIPDIYSQEELERYIVRWDRRDGEGGMIISDFFCDFCMREPAIFLDVMAKNQRVFNEWLEEMGDLSFTDYSGCIDPSCIRQKLIDSLTDAKYKRKNDKLLDKLLDKLNKIVVRKID